MKPSVIQSVAATTAAPCLSLLLLTQQAVNNTQQRDFNIATAADILWLLTILQLPQFFHESSLPLPPALLQKETNVRF